MKSVVRSLYLVAGVASCICIGFGVGCRGSSLEESLFGDNLKVILEYGGIPAVILLFGYLYLRSLMKEYGKQLGSMQEQINIQQTAMNMLILNNTKALTRLGTAMMMGCPLVKSQVDQAALEAEEGIDDGQEGSGGGASETPGSSGG